MIVILDTNVWLSTLALTSGVGSAVRYFLREQNARLGLPEVVKLETEVHLRADLLGYIEAIRKNHRQLLALFGRLKEVVLPTDAEVEALVERVFANLGVQVEEIPFTDRSARASLMRTIRKIPPSDRDQQFKDGVLWEDCLMILGREPVSLVTSDKAFYDGHDTKKGLADALRKDIQGQPNTLSIFPDLNSLLATIKTPVQVPQEVLLRGYLALRESEIRAMAASRSFEMDGEPNVKVETFATEKPTVLYISFSIEFPCSDAAEEGRSGARLLVSGEGSYDVSTQKVTEIILGQEQLIFLLQDGTEQKQTNHFLRAACVIGHRSVEHSIRHAL